MAEHGHIDPAALERSLQQLAGQGGDQDLHEAMQQVLEAARVMFHATGTGLMFIDENAALRYVAATDEAGKLLEQRQEELGKGPCVDALTFDVIVQSEDLAADDRWPELRPDVTAAGVRAVLGVPVHLAGTAIASLDAYVDEPYRWDDSEIRALEAYANLIGNIVAGALQARRRGELAEQLQEALDNRVTIERAVGMIMALRGLDAVSAFNELRRAARNRGRKVVSVAEDLLGGAPFEP